MTDTTKEQILLLKELVQGNEVTLLCRINAKIKELETKESRILNRK